MPRDLFGTMVDPRAGIGPASRVTLPLSLAAHGLALAALVVAPLVATGALPPLSRVTQVVIGEPAVPPEPPQRRPAARERVAPNRAVALARASDVVESEALSSLPAAEGEPVPHSVDGVPGRAFELAGEALLAPPSPPQTSLQPIRVGGLVEAPAKVYDVAPAYPPLALSARKEGMVILQATIGVSGNVEQVEVLRSVPLLDQAAIDAVRQWRFTPTRLNGQAVAVIMTVTVNFSLR